MSKTIEHGLSDKLSISGAREIGFELERCYLLILQTRKRNDVQNRVLARIERTLDARKAAR